MGPESSGTGQCCQKLAEKLEKSESGRKKLRQAISLLKEKMEATEKVLQINETLRQDLEKERNRAEAESKEACEQRRLREEMQHDGCHCKDEMVHILQRLDVVENCQKTDRTAVDRLLMEVRQSLKGLGSPLQAIEAAQNAFQALEKDFLSKVNAATLASEKASNLAKSGHQTALSALTACGTSQSTAKTAQAAAMSVQAELQKLTASVTLVQEQSSRLEEQIATLLQSTSNRAIKNLDSSGVTTGTGRMATGLGNSKSKSKFGRGMVLSKSQLQNTQLDQGQRVTEGGSAVVTHGGAPALKGAASVAGTVQSTASSSQPSAIAASKIDEPPSATEAQLLSVRVESLQTQHRMLEQQVSTLLQGGKADDHGKCIAAADVAGDRMSSGFIRPRNRSKDVKPFLPHAVQIQSREPSFEQGVCEQDGEANLLSCPRTAKCQSVMCLDEQLGERKEGSAEELSQMCSLSVQPVAPVETSPSTKTRTSGAAPLDLMESMRQLVLKGNRNQSKMLSRLQALQDALQSSGQENKGNIIATERLQESARSKLKRKRSGRQGCDDSKDDLGQVGSKVKKRSKERRRRRREEDSRYEKHHIIKGSVPPQVAEKHDLEERCASTRVGGDLDPGLKALARFGYGELEVHEALTLDLKTCSPSKCNDHVESEGSGQLQLHGEDGVEDGGAAAVVSQWGLDSGCDDKLWADWLAGKLELLSPYLPSIYIPPLQDGTETEGRCSVAVGATGVGDQISTAVEVPSIVHQGAGENCPDVLTCSDDGGKPLVPENEAIAVPEKLMVAEETEAIHSNILAAGEGIDDNPPAGEDAAKQPDAEGIPHLNSTEKLVLDVM